MVMEINKEVILQRILERFKLVKFLGWRNISDTEVMEFWVDGDCFTEAYDMNIVWAIENFMIQYFNNSNIPFLVKFQNPYDKKNFS
jgi:hypothetical protein